MTKGKLVLCVPNFSEGRDLKKIQKIASAAKIKGVKILDVEWDRSHNRSLVTIVGEPKKVSAAAFQMIKTATNLIDMEKHRGEHPRIGATDVCPFVPLSEVTMKDCVDLAESLGKRVARELKIPVYLYEAAAKNKNRVNLANIRRGEYEGLKQEIGKLRTRKPDFGPEKLHPKAGAVVIGARKYLIAYNVNLDTTDVEVAKKIAARVREKGGGLKGVKALGFKVGAKAQVSMNLVDFEKTNFSQAFLKVKEEAAKFKVKVASSEIYGMVPLEAMVSALKETFLLKDFTADQIVEKRIYE